MFFLAGLGAHRASVVILELATLLTCALITANSFFNYFLLRRVRNLPSEYHDEVAVLLPMRNESENVTELVNILKGQRGLSSLTFHCLDDESTDDTFALLRLATADDSRFVLHRGAPLMGGWIGKPFALQQALDLSRSQIVVIIDSDVRLTPYAIASSINTMTDLKLDFMSAYPRQLAKSWPERLIQPLLQWSWTATVPLRIAERMNNPAFAVANGQFFIATRDALNGVNGFNQISAQVLDDIALARVLLRSGFRGTVSDASKVASCRMYSSWTEIKQGYGKSLRVAFRSPIGFTVTAAFLILTGIIPLALALSGSILGLLSLVLIVLSRAISAASSSGRIRDAIWHPISTLLLMYLIGYSVLMRSQIRWKGRQV